MFKTVTVLALGALAATATPVLAKGCIKGAVAGGVVGHMAGHHGMAGAAVGCAMGHHHAAMKAKAANAQPKPAM